MADDADADLDRHLRNAFEPESEAVSRVAANALSARAALPRRRWPRVAAAAAVVCIAAALALWRAQPAPQVEPAEAPLSGSIADGILVVTLPDGSVAISGGEARPGRPDDGYGIVIVEGELR
jgi:ferric-dicitrate binding protein FerR (iron transport regulator)